MAGICAQERTRRQMRRQVSADLLALDHASCVHQPTGGGLSRTRQRRLVIVKVY